MIEEEDRLLFAATFRSKILRLTGELKDASASHLSYTDPTPNSLTMRRTGAIARWFEEELMRLHGLTFHEYADCGAPEHRLAVERQRRDGKYYWLTASANLPPEAFSFDVRGRMAVEGRRMDCSVGVDRRDCEPRYPCPCGGRPVAGRHAIRVGYATPLAAVGLSEIDAMASAAERLWTVWRLADRKTTRSTLREHMMMAVQDLDKAIIGDAVERRLQERRIVVPYEEG